MSGRAHAAHSLFLFLALFLSRTFRVLDVKDCPREIISFINQRPYVSASSHLIPPHADAPYSAVLSRSRRLHADKRGEKWLKFINDIFMDGKFSILKKAESLREEIRESSFF